MPPGEVKIEKCVTSHSFY